jgi:hypothetical protein
MVITRLIGGLGNQMFQYALGRALAAQRDTTLKLDISGYERYALHAYALHPFNILESFAARDEIRRLRGGGWVTEQVPRRLQKLNPLRKKSYILERGFPFDPAVLDAPDDVYLDGYWQSEKYFKNMEDVLRREFTVRHALSGHNQELAARIAACNAVSLHVRRGDYASNSDTSRVHGLCGMDYYRSAALRIAEGSSRPHFFVFSDEPEWAAGNLRLDYPMTIVTGNDASHNYEDLRLMSLCSHHIIANSSFSWWGAWLGANPDKVVIAPSRWFASEQHNTRDLLPFAWITI